MYAMAANPNSLAFFDTNIIVYTDDRYSPEKQKIALALFDKHLRSNTAVVSLQVLQEYFATATRKLGMPPEIVQRKVELLGRARVVRFGVSDVIAAIELHRLNRTSFWDALIIHAARQSGATVVYTEDLQAGSMLAGVKVVNPFSGVN